MARIPRRLAGIGAADLPDATAFDIYVGPAREVTVDPVRGLARLHDGATPGGIPIGGEGEESDLLVPETVTASTYTPILADGGDKLKRLSDASGVALTIPTTAAVAFPIGTILSFEQLGAGQITVAGDVGVTVRKQASVNAKSAGQYSIIQVAKIDTNEWILFGALETSQQGYLLGSTQVFTSSGTWTKPAGCAAVRVRVIGGGGGGAGVTGTASNVAAGGGGGAGGEAVKWITSGLGATETVTIGAGGAGGTAGNAGTDGGASSFGSHCSGAGGSGGATMAAGTSPTTAAGGAGGAGSNGDVNVTGGAGHRGLRLSGSVGFGGEGGNTSLGHGGGVEIRNDGATGQGYGAGGGGAADYAAGSRTGGAGKSGIVIVEEYY